MLCISIECNSISAANYTLSILPPHKNSGPIDESDTLAFRRWGIACNTPAIWSLLLDHGEQYDPSYKYSFGNKFINNLITTKNPRAIDCIKEILSRGYKVYATYDIPQCIEFGDDRIMTFLLSQLSIDNLREARALHQVAEAGKLSMMWKLIRMGIHVNEIETEVPYGSPRGDWGVHRWTPLHKVVNCCRSRQNPRLTHLGTVCLLMACGANCWIEDEYGSSPLMKAWKTRQCGLVAAMITVSALRLVWDGPVSLGNWIFRKINSSLGQVVDDDAEFLRGRLKARWEVPSRVGFRKGRAAKRDS
jgi:hypothetical protein